MSRFKMACANLDVPSRYEQGSCEDEVAQLDRGRVRTELEEAQSERGGTQHRSGFPNEPNDAGLDCMVEREPIQEMSTVCELKHRRLAANVDSAQEIECMGEVVAV